MVNRSQNDINTKKDIKKALEAERQFFVQHNSYKHIVERMGTRYLQQNLNQELKDHIMNKLPQIRRELNQKLKEINQELKEIGFDENESRDTSQTIINLLFSFQEIIAYSIDGQGMSREEVNTSDITGGVYINRSFYQDFNNFFNEAINNSESINKDVSIAITNEHGMRNALFASEKVIDMAVANCLKNYEGETKQLIKLN